MMMSTVDVILCTDQGYKDAHYRYTEAKSALEAAAARSQLARAFSDVEICRDRIAEENALLEPHHHALVALQLAALAAIDRWIAKRSEP